jgi:transcriptional regulator with XRE-family HTH domain
MEDIKLHEKLKLIMSQQKLSQCKLSKIAEMTVTSFNQAFNGKIPFYPTWRKLTATALNMTEDEVFPEYAKKKIAQ